MPDLCSHVLGGYTVGKIIAKGTSVISLVLLGAILPDLYEKPLGLVFPHLHYYLLASHSIWVQFCLCMLIAINIKVPESRKAFVYLFTGALSHLFLDSLQYTIRRDHYPFFAPISYVELPLFLVPSERWIWILIPLSILSLCVFILSKKFKNIEEGVLNGE